MEEAEVLHIAVVIEAGDGVAVEVVHGCDEKDAHKNYEEVELGMQVEDKVFCFYVLLPEKLLDLLLKASNHAERHDGFVGRLFLCVDLKARADWLPGGRSAYVGALSPAL